MKLKVVEESTLAKKEVSSKVSDLEKGVRRLQDKFVDVEDKFREGQSYSLWSERKCR